MLYLGQSVTIKYSLQKRGKGIKLPRLKLKPQLESAGCVSVENLNFKWPLRPAWKKEFMLSL